MRQVGLVLIAFIMLWPSVAMARGDTASRVNRGECRRMTKQINHYENVVLKRAQDRGDKGWEAAMDAQLDVLKNRRADRCPEYAKQRGALRAMADEARKFNALMKAAAKGAAKYFSGGWM